MGAFDAVQAGPLQRRLQSHQDRLQSGAVAVDLQLGNDNLLRLELEFGPMICRVGYGQLADFG